jgi:hypothetical protein
MHSNDNELSQLYRNVFSSHEGQVVLFHILEELGFHKIISTEEEKILKNYAMRLLEIIGGGRMDQYSVQGFIISLMGQQLEGKEHHNE